MKLKYYLRGLAIGVILTTLILTIAKADNKPLTDAQIRQRALELGMIEGSALKLTDVQEESKESAPSSEPAKDSGESVTAESSSVAESTASAPESTSSEPAATTDTRSTAEAETSTDTQVETESTKEQVEVVTITIKGGDSSYTVSKALAAAGMVEDAVDFDNYLCNYGYSRSIRTGTYEIRSEMTYEEIAKLIAR